ncbi:uncharacterized protein [Antedon mediterranea]|uniref:uncharacterized protein n=1 Tax=Antedon mediterranea TaxID=105859 RepID=UPI003AF4C4D9
MATVFSLQFLTVKAAVKILLDHDDRHSVELRKNAKTLLKQLSTQCFTAISLDILETFVDQHPRLLTGELLEVLVAPHMKRLCLNQCTGILCDQEELKHLGNVMKKCPRLQHIQLNKCHPPSETTTELCLLIGQNLQTLTSLSFEYCKTLSNENVQRILINCRNLSQLNLSMCSGITDQVFNLKLSSSSESKVEGTSIQETQCGSPGQHLTDVDVSCNQNLTSTCIRYLVALCGSSLQVLNVSYTGMDCTLLWYLCGHTWYDAVELASTFNQDTSGSVTSNLMREYQTLELEMMFTKESEESDIDDLPRVYKVTEEKRKKPDDKEVVDKPKNGHHDAPLQLNHVTKHKNPVEGNALLNQDTTIEGVKLGVGKPENEVIVQKSEEDLCQSVGRLVQPNDAQNDLQNIDSLDRMHQKNVKTEEEETRPEASDVETKGNPDVVFVPAETNNYQEEHENVKLLELEDVKLSFNEFSLENTSFDCVVDTLAASALNEITLLDNAKDSHDADFPDDRYSVSNNEQAVSINSEQAVSNGSSRAVGVNPSEVMLPMSDTSSDSTESSKASLTLRSQHDESLNRIVSEFVDNMLQEICHECSDENADSNGDADSFLDFNKPTSKQTETEVITDEISGHEFVASSAVKVHRKWAREFIPNIKDLDISNIEFDDSMGEICFQEFLNINTCLLKLNLSWKGISDDLLSRVQSSLTNLRWLSMSECENITSHGLSELLNVCKDLTHLTIEGMYFINDTALCPLFSQDGRCGVHSLKLSETYITDYSLNRIAKYLGSKLTILHLNWCEEITDGGLCTITANCHRLTDFAIRQCSTSKSTLIQLADNCPNLVALNVAAVDCLADDIIITMATRLCFLKRLDVSWNSELTDVTVCCLLINCPLLDNLCLDGLKCITSKPFLPIIAELVRWRRCQALIKLKLKEQKLLKKLGEPHLSSDEEYEDLFVPTRSTTYALHLRYLSLQYCDLVNDRHLAEIVAICKGTLTIKDYYGEQIVPKLLDYR